MPRPFTTDDVQKMSADEIQEMVAVGIVRRENAPNCLSLTPPPFPYSALRVIRATKVSTNLLNEASDYGSAFARAAVVKIQDGDHLMLVSGTASIGDGGETMYPGDFRAQLWRTYRNITGLLASREMDWFDVIRTTCYLRDIERDYADFNLVRTLFFNWMGLHPYPVSTGIQAILCRPDLLIEIEVMALYGGDTRTEGL